MKTIPFLRRPITHNFKRPHSKAEEPDPVTAGFRRNLPSSIITTHPPEGRGNFELTPRINPPLPWRERDRVRGVIKVQNRPSGFHLQRIFSWLPCTGPAGTDGLRTSSTGIDSYSASSSSWSGSIPYWGGSCFR